MITVFEFEPQRKELTVYENVDWRTFSSKENFTYWWDLAAADAEEAAVLSEKFRFHPLSIEDCLGDVHYPKIDYYDNYFYLVIHGVDFDRSQVEGFAPKELDVFLGPKLLVTYHKNPSRAVAEIRRRCKEKAPLFDQGLDFLLYNILDVMVTNYLPVLESIEEELQHSEDEIFSNPHPDLLRNILQLKRTSMRLKKTVFPQREVINHLSRNEYQFIKKRTQVYFRDVYDHIYRMAEMTESFRDMSTAMVEIYLSNVSNRTNDIMKVLTMITLILMPLTVITGIYGMNFDSMPELRWRYGYFVVLGIMMVVVLSLITYFKRKQWL